MSLEWKSDGEVKRNIQQGYVKVIETLDERPIAVTYDDRNNGVPIPIKLPEYVGVSGRIKVETGTIPMRIVSKGESVAAPRMVVVSQKSPLVINLNKIDYCEGEWNEEKTLYGVRVYFSGGNSIRLEDEIGRKFLDTLLGEHAEREGIGYRHATSQKTVVERFDAVRNGGSKQ